MIAFWLCYKATGAMACADIVGRGALLSFALFSCWASKMTPTHVRHKHRSPNFVASLTSRCDRCSAVTCWGVHLIHIERVARVIFALAALGNSRGSSVGESLVVSRVIPSNRNSRVEEILASWHITMTGA